MSDYFNSKVCDQSIKIKYKKKPLNSINYKFLSMSVVSRYCVTNPDFLHIENILKNVFLIIIKNLHFI